MDLTIRSVAETVGSDEPAAAVRDPPAFRGSVELVGVDRAPRIAGSAIDEQQVPRRSRPIGSGHLDDGRSAEMESAGRSAQHSAQARVSVERPAVDLVAGIGGEQRHPAVDVVAVEREAVASEKIADGRMIFGCREHGSSQGFFSRAASCEILPEDSFTRRDRTILPEAVRGKGSSQTTSRSGSSRTASPSDRRCSSRASRVASRPASGRTATASRSGRGNHGSAELERAERDPRVRPCLGRAQQSLDDHGGAAQPCWRPPR